MTNTVLLAIVAMLVLVTVAVILRYRTSGSAEFSIFDWIKFRFSGTNVPATNGEGDVPEPPTISIVAVTRKREYVSELDVPIKINNAPRRVPFHLALANDGPVNAASNVSVRLEFSWRGQRLEKPPKFFPPQGDERWTVERANITDQQPATLSFQDPTLTVFQGHPVQWKEFRVQFNEKPLGSILLQYSVSTAEPDTTNSGDILIDMKPSH